MTQRTVGRAVGEAFVVILGLCLIAVMVTGTIALVVKLVQWATS